MGGDSFSRWDYLSGECGMDRWLLAAIDSKQDLGNFSDVNS